MSGRFSKLNHAEYQVDVGIIRKYNENTYKILHLNTVRQKGIEVDNRKNKGINQTKLKNNIIRTKSKIYELAICNPWEYFITLTLDKGKYNRHALQKYKKDLAQWIRNYNRKHNIKIQYLLIPEPHKDGAWHMHGFFMGLSEEHMDLFSTSDKIPKKIKEMLIAGRNIYNWLPYVEKFGYVTAEAIQDNNKIASYITKYISKESETTIKELNAHSYFCSEGLKRSEVVYRDFMQKAIENPDFVNDYVAIKTSDKLEELLVCFGIGGEESYNSAIT